jgi:hypothetical protein
VISADLQHQIEEARLADYRAKVAAASASVPKTKPTAVVDHEAVARALREPWAPEGSK